MYLLVTKNLEACCRGDLNHSLINEFRNGKKGKFSTTKRHINFLQTLSLFALTNLALFFPKLRNKKPTYTNKNRKN